MTKLESIAKDGRGFWFNRSIILRNIRNLTIVVRKDTKELSAFYVITTRKTDGASVIDFMQVFCPGQGLGRLIIEKEVIRPYLCVEEALPESTGFWDKMGIPYDSVANYYY